jgi:NADH-ubiquinone oxidoreductase chain 5
MAAPTPVSALVHSSTLVTAGIYILIRFSYYFPLIIKEVLLIFAFITVFLGSLNALSSFDRKKIIAYSTLRNLGLLGVSIGCGFIGLSFFHLLAHGISKALLFISTGKMMFKNFHFQDLRKFSKL